MSFSVLNAFGFLLTNGTVVCVMVYETHRSIWNWVLALEDLWTCLNQQRSTFFSPSFSLTLQFASTKLIFHVGLCTSSHRAFPLNYYAIYKNQPIPVYHFLGLKTSCVRCVRCVRFMSVLFLVCALLAFDLDSDFWDPRLCHMWWYSVSNQVTDKLKYAYPTENEGVIHFVGNH